MPWSNQGVAAAAVTAAAAKAAGRGARVRGAQGGGGGKEPPDLDEILRRGQDKVQQVMRGGGGGNGGGGGGLGGGVPKPFLFLIAMLLLAGVAFYGFFFRVNPDEQGIVLRFGKFDRWEGPRAAFPLAYPIEEVRLPKVTQQRTIEVGSWPTARSGDAEQRLDADGRRQRRRRALRRVLAHQSR